MSLSQIYEKQLLARIINNKDDYFENADIIQEDHFVHYSDVFEKFLELVKINRFPTLAKLLNLLPDRSGELKEMVLSVDYDVPIGELVSELEEDRRLRFLNNALTTTAMKDTSDEKVKILTDSITNLYQSQTSQFKSGYELIKNSIRLLDQPEGEIEMPTGFAYIDTLTRGWQRSDLVVIGAEPSQGKTSFALCTSLSVMKAGKSVGIISLEMSEQQLSDRYLSITSGVSTKEFRSHLAHVTQAGSTFEKYKSHIADVTNNSVTHVLGLIRAAHIRHGIDIVIVDYIQLLADKNQKSREQEVGQAARALKNIAKELKICVIILSQLSRPAKGHSHYPTMSRLRDSGQVEEAADLVIFIHRPEAHGNEEFDDGENAEGKAEIIIAKGRNYGTGKFRCEFIKESTTFTDYRNRSGFPHSQGFTEADEEEEPF